MSSNFQDARSKKVCFISHCMINSNAIYNGSRTMDKYPAIVDPVVFL